MRRYQVTTSMVGRCCVLCREGRRACTGSAAADKDQKIQATDKPGIKRLKSKKKLNGRKIGYNESWKEMQKGAGVTYGNVMLAWCEIGVISCEVAFMWRDVIFILMCGVVWFHCMAVGIRFFFRISIWCTEKCEIRSIAKLPLNIWVYKLYGI
jgi:hypothetical protein